MKATLATLACLLTVGFLSAAEVTGNNTAVVIRKNTVESDTGYQFLCVPVDGLDIANGTQKTVKLSTVLPANTVPNGTQVIFVGGTATGSRTANNGEWSEDAVLKGGQIFWLKYQVSRNAKTSKPDTVIFCGQDRARTPGTPETGVVTAMANDSSNAIKLKDVIAAPSTPGDLDTILVIQEDSSDYKQYNYFGGTWYGPNGVPSNDAEIAPGEAFYYFKRR